MAENSEKKKPNTTLIKHRKPEKDSSPPVKEATPNESGTETSTDKPDSKKVVVVRKKRKVVVKASTSPSTPEAVSNATADASDQSSKAAPKSDKPVSKGDNVKAPETAVDTTQKELPSQNKASGKPVQKQDSSVPPNDKKRFPKRHGSAKESSTPPVKRGVQVLENSRTGGRAGVVAGQRVDGSQNRSRRGGTAGNAPGRSGFRSPGSSGDSRQRNRSSSPYRNPPGTRRPAGSAAAPGKSPGLGKKPAMGAGRSGGMSNAVPPPSANRSKKFYKAKKTYEKRKEEQEKLYHYSKKKQVVQTNPVPKEIEIMEVITVSELARKMNLKASNLISKLMSLGKMVTINQQIDAETATILADDYDCNVKIVSLYDETIIQSDASDDHVLRSRPPIVTVMGHVDHGKTKLLDAIRNTDVTSGEHGGITQHIGAYMVHTDKGNISFLDTPGHSAFTRMRARGAQITDLVVLVVAANDGVKPQTIEAVEHAKASGSPIIVAINKMDLPEANAERVKQQLSEYDLVPEEWGGTTQFVEISALKAQGIDTLLDTLILESEMLELKTNWDCRAEGKVIESKIDQGRGTVSTVLIEKGVLKTGDAFVAGIYHGKVRAMFDDMGNALKEATPALPVEILGFSGIPNAGDPFQVTQSEREARQFASKRQELKKMETVNHEGRKLTLDNLYDSIQEGVVQELKIVIKADVQGSVEALKSTLEKLSTNEIRLVCIRAAAGAIIEDDVNLASASDAIIIGFHVRPTSRAQTIAEREKVEIRKYNIIYHAVDDVKEAMEGMLTPDFEEVSIGQVEVRETFKVPKIGLVAGCMVTSGYIARKSQIHLIRDNVVIHSGALASLKRFKDEVKEVKEGYECGVALENYSNIEIGDIFDVFEMKEIAKKLGEKE